MFTSLSYLYFIMFLQIGTDPSLMGILNMNDGEGMSGYKSHAEL